MHILVVCDVLPDPNSGASGTIWQTVAALRKEGHDVDAIWGNEMPRRLRHHGLHHLLEQPRAYRAAVMHALDRRHYEVVQVSQIHGYAAARAMRARGKGSVFVHKSHGLEARVRATVTPQLEALAMDRRPPIKRLATAVMDRMFARHDRLMVRHADGHLVGCTDCRDFLVTRLGASPTSVAIVPTAPPEEYLETGVRGFDEVRARRVLHVGQFAFFKGSRRVADIFRQLAQADPGLEFTWVCAGKDHREVRRLCGTAIGNRLRLVDWCAQSALLRVYDEHGLFVFPTLFEGFSKALLEAMSRGLCAVASDVGGARDLIRDGETGFLCAGYDCESMAARILFLRRNPEVARAVSSAARECALAYTWSRTAQSMTAFFSYLRERHLATGQSA